MSDYDLDQYDFNLPPGLIAQEPASPRESARLLVLNRKSQTWEHLYFGDLEQILDSDDLMVVNNSRVLKARLVGHRLIQKGNDWIRGGKIEFLLLEKVRPNVWEGLFHASVKPYVPGIRFEIPRSDGTGLRGTLVRGSAESPTGSVLVEFDQDPVSAGIGEIPLPHYIQRRADLRDESHYQTVFAKDLGSAAAPTAGLHFTNEMLEKLERKKVNKEEVTLHVGLGTFRPVKEKDIRLHPMHEERYEIQADVARRIEDWKSQKKRILAVGTTSVRTLESAWINEGPGCGFLKEGIGRTSLFIKPGEYRFQVVDRLLTNFHLPRSTLLMLVCAFAGREFALAAYEEAIKKGYRFFSYGDAMLVI